jgi:hypothetical protein
MGLFVLLTFVNLAAALYISCLTLRQAYNAGRQHHNGYDA